MEPPAVPNLRLIGVEDCEKHTPKQNLRQPAGVVMYLTRKKRIGRSKELDDLAQTSGDVWSDVAKWFWRIVDRQDYWMSKSDFQRWLCGSSRYPGMQSHSIQAVWDQFYDALNGWRKRRKDSPDTRPPHRQKKWNKAVWKSSGISFDDGTLKLSRGRGYDPLEFDWDHPEPKRVEMVFNSSIGEYVLCCQYEVEPEDRTTGDEVAGIDLGVIHLAAVDDGEKCYLFNGKEVRSKQRYLNKLKAKLNSKIDRKQKGSNRWWKLVESKKKQTGKVRNQINDILHKQSRRLVESLLERRVSTLAIGNVKDIRQGLDYGSKTNQQLHQWIHGRFRRMIEYKAKLAGMDVKLVDEAYTSQTCPGCGHRRKPKGRDYDCSECSFSGHRDQVGAINIRRKYLGEVSEKSSSRVVGDMASPSGIRFHANSPCSSRSDGKTCLQAAA